MHTLAKRVHNIAPRPMDVTFETGATVRLTVRSAEFFQEEFQAEGVTDTGTVYRFVSDGTDDPLVAAERADDTWRVVGEVVDVSRVEE